MAKKHEAPTDRVRLRRLHLRAAYDFDSVAAILDQQPQCSVGYCFDGKPFVIPTFQWREGARVYWHGSAASSALKRSIGIEVCMNVNILDGFVLARSAMHHSANYRSVTIYGTAEKVADDHKAAALKRFVDALIPGRWDNLRAMNDQEIKATTILSMPIEEASAKVRTGGPSDDEEDYALPIWAGVLPVTTRSGELIPDDKNLPGVDVPDHLKTFRFQP